MYISVSIGGHVMTFSLLRIEDEEDPVPEDDEPATDALAEALDLGAEPERITTHPGPVGFHANPT